MARYNLYWQAPLERPKEPGVFKAALGKLRGYFSRWQDVFPPVNEEALERTRAIARALGITAVSNNGTVYIDIRDSVSNPAVPASQAELDEIVTEHTAGTSGTNPFWFASVGVSRQSVLHMKTRQPKMDFAIFPYTDNRRVVKLYPGGFSHFPDMERVRGAEGTAVVRWLMPEAVEHEPGLLSVPDIHVGYLGPAGEFQPGPHEVRLDNETLLLFGALHLASEAGARPAHVKIESGMVSNR